MKEQCLILVVLALTVSVEAWGENKDRVLLEKVTAITLVEGKMTNARRSSAVPQLDCVGGSAGCHGHRPKVVQCKNVGFDGYDVQWECTADMDNKYRFAEIEVSCEGYDNPEDPYILRGSCGLRYQLDWTSDGHRERRDYGHRDGYYGNSHGDSSYSSSGSSLIGTLIQLAVIGLIIYCVLGACFGARRHSGSSSSTGGTGYSTGSTFGGSGGGSGGPGFWSGAATGGMLGYLFGSRNTGRRYGGGYGSGYGSGWGSGYGSGWGNTSGGWSSGGSSSFRSSGSRSSGSRSTSGFGGTTRR